MDLDVDIDKLEEEIQKFCKPKRKRKLKSHKIPELSQQRSVPSLPRIRFLEKAED